MPVRKARLQSILRWTGLAALAAVLAGLSFFVTLRVSIVGGEVVVPHVEGLSLTEAEGRLSERGFAMVTEASRHDHRVARERVLTQDPPPGTLLKDGRTVRVVESLGPPQVPVPELVGTSERRAQLLLRQTGLQLGHVTLASDARIEAGRVISQDPPAGTVKPQSFRIDVLVSGGPPDRALLMPRLIGAREEEGRRALAAAGIEEPRVSVDPRAVAPAGTVVRQVPLPGYPLPEGGSVVLIVAQGASASGDGTELDYPKGVLRGRRAGSL